MLECQLDWIRIVDFLLTANFLGSQIFFASVSSGQTRGFQVIKHKKVIFDKANDCKLAVNICIVIPTLTEHQVEFV